MPTSYPVALFAHRRADLLAQALEALRLARVPHIYAYVDGSRGPSDDTGHAAVMALLERIDWADVTLTARPTNVGLHASLCGGLDDFFAREPAGVVIEEDIRLAPGAYAWLCEALDRYTDTPAVGAISAWTHPRCTPADVMGPWWCARWSGWGWASWRATWELMREPVDGLLERLAREGIDAAANGGDVVTLARLGFWDAQFALACYGARALTLTPPRNLADHLGVGGDASNQHAAAQWRTVAAAPRIERWSWPDVVLEHPDSAGLWRKAAVADAPARAARSLGASVRRRLSVAWHRLSRAWRQWPEALALRLALAVYRLRAVRLFDDEAPGVTTPIRFLWNGFLGRHRDAFFGRGLEIGDSRTITALGGLQMTCCEVLDIAARPGVDHAVDLQHAWALPEGRFDVFLNQFTVHLVEDDRAFLWHSLRAVRAEGTLLVNFPCASAAPPTGATYGATHSVVWRAYTLPGVRALLAGLGVDENHMVLEPLGGAGAMAAYLLGVPVEAMDRRTIAAVDPDAPLLIAARITKPVHWAPPWSPSR